MRNWIVTFVGCVQLCAVGCEDEVLPPDISAPAPTTGQRKSRKPKMKEDAEKQDQAPPKVEFQEEDFVETERSRDPFRSFKDLFSQKNKKDNKIQRTVILSKYSLDELKLIGIVSRINPAVAMLVDPKGQGYVVHRGDFVGRAERVQGPTPEADYQINWRVERIRENDMVFIREDPSNPDVPTATRVIALRKETDDGLMQ